MSELELLQPEISLRNARKPHEMATLQFGKENADTWTDFLTFEMKYGEPLRVANIHDRAVKTLKHTLVDNFLARYSLLKMQPQSHDISV